MRFDIVFMFILSVFFFKQKTAYDMRISDWSSDVCSSDLLLVELVLALVSVDRALRRVDAHVAHGFQQIDLGAGLFVPARVAVVGGQHSRQHLAVTAGGARFAARAGGLVVTVTFDAVVGVDLTRLVALAQALDRSYTQTAVSGKRWYVR